MLVLLVIRVQLVVVNYEIWFLYGSSEMKKGLFDLVFIMDRSGSMDAIKNDAIGGFNKFIETQKALPGEAKFTLVLFDHEYLIEHNGVNLQSVKPLDNNSYVPRGMTALLDAVGRTITDVGNRLSNVSEDERPEKVVVAIMTDGEENASTDYNKDKINKMIGHQRDMYQWEFIFLAAGQDAIKAGASMGIPMQASINFAQTGDGVMRAMSTASNYMANTRSSTSHDWDKYRKDTE